MILVFLCNLYNEILPVPMIVTGIQILSQLHFVKDILLFVTVVSIHIYIGEI